MVFPKHPFKIALFLIMTFQVACTDEKGTKNDKNGGIENKSHSKLSDVSQTRGVSPLQQAEDYISKGKINEAIQVLSDALKKSPENIAILYQLGNLHLQLGDSVKAIKTIQQSIDLGNTDPDAIMKLGFLLANKNDENCLKYAQMLILENKNGKTNYMGFFLRGIYFANIGKRKEAMLAFDNSIIANYRFIDSYIEKAILLYESNEFNKSLKLLQKGIEIDRYQADLYYWIGRNSEKLKDLDESIYAYEQTLTLAPEFINAKIRLDSLNKIKNK